MFTGTKNFTVQSVACQCGCGMLPDADFMNKVQWVRDAVGFALPVTSGARCAKHNAAVSATGDSGPHTTGHAIDLAVRGTQAFYVVSAMLRHGFTGIGVSQKGDKRFIHGDDLANSLSAPRPWIWSY
jgi:uncharacterized protein YcbK (DUF882 family)